MDTKSAVAAAVSQSSPPKRGARMGKMIVGVTPGVSQMLDLMVEEGLRYQEAAARAGLHVRVARKAIDKPTVLNELKRRKRVFRESLAAANPLRLAELRDQDENRAAAVAAAKALEVMPDDDRPDRAALCAPGITIVITQPHASTPLDHPLIDIEAAPSDPETDGS